MYNARKRTLRRKAYRARRRVRKGTRKVIQRAVNRALKSNLEVKRYVSTATEQAVSTLTQGTNWVQPFVNISQGLNSYHRIGNKIKVIGLQMKNFFNNNSTTGLWMRFVVLRILDKTVPGSTSNIFATNVNAEDNFSGVTGIATMMRPIHPAFAKVVYNKVFKLTANSSEGASAYKRLYKFIKFPRGLNIEYNSSGTGVSNSNAQYVIGCWTAEAPEDVGAGNTVEWTYEMNVFYTDA